MRDPTGIGRITRLLLNKRKNDATSEEQIDSDSDATPKSLKKSKPKFLSVALLLLPIALSGVYFFGIARNRYVVQSDFGE